MSVKFDAKNFTTLRVGPWDRIIETRAIDVAKGNPLRGWRRAPTKGLESNVDVVFCRDTKVTAVIVDFPAGYVPSTLGAEYLVTTYWDADPNQVLEIVRGTREFLDLDGEWEWCGGGVEMDRSKVYGYLSSMTDEK